MLSSTFFQVKTIVFSPTQSWRLEPASSTRVARSEPATAIRIPSTAGFDSQVGPHASSSWVGLRREPTEG